MANLLSLSADWALICIFELPKDGYMRRATSTVGGPSFLAIVAPLLSGVCLAQSPTFALQELSSAGGAGSTVYGINNAGEAVGYIGIGSSICSTLCAVTWQDGTPTALAAVQGATDSVASDINNSGQIVGNVTMTQSSRSLNAAVIWNNGTPALLQSPGPQYPQTFANSINDAGEVAGFAELASGTGAPVVWNGLTPTVLGMASGCTGDSIASGINNNGLVVGFMQCGANVPVDEAVVWHGTTPTVLPEVKSQHAPGGKALAANNFGLVVGTANNPSSYAYATAWKGTVVTNLGVLGTGIRSTATAVNDQGIIVGESSTEGEGPPFHASLWSRVGAETQDLNALISAAEAKEILLTEAVGINNSCAIVANGYYRKNLTVEVAFLLTLIDASSCVNGM
jgi:uncharacterized membrane protein